MENTNKQKLFIQGITSDGKKFRPSDWAERLCSCVSQYQSTPNSQTKWISYSLYAMPVQLYGEQAAMIDPQLEHIDPLMFNFLINFAKSNNLPILEGCEI